MKGAKNDVWKDYRKNVKFFENFGLNFHDDFENK